MRQLSISETEQARAEQLEEQITSAFMVYSAAHTLRGASVPGVDSASCWPSAAPSR